MHPQAIDHVQRSFAAVRPIAEQAAALFYQRLFALDPSLRSLFKGDMARQGQMLMSVLGSAVAGLRDLDRLTPVLLSLGARHVGYRVQDAHYDTVGAALLWTLEQGLGEAFTPEVRAAWAETYDTLAGVMKLGAAAEMSAQRARALAAAPTELEYAAIAGV